ncbi:MFS transporter [Pontibacillus litoralis]|uniref:MFS transporter n=1 Tax=Pontibacillus litoralis JSM 072002 TaxID=1385512 RepID=A0A0A5GAR8_9BACI|nr:MFS transporter [Pontibacillus litoralis]KGX88210.1 MFS transporter [Pontibacillus litoralis JSM 072002]
MSEQNNLGIKNNLLPFFLLVFINFFVGSMVGLERTVLPLIGEEHFGMVSASASISFIVSFGFSKAIVNFFAGNLSDRIGRKQVLLLGWGIGILVPFFIIIAESWWVIVFSNVLLGLNQGLTWSMTVNMKIDIAKSTERGIAVGLNEFAGYIGVAVAAIASGYVATTYSLSPEPFYIGIGIAIIGFFLSLFVQETSTSVSNRQAQSKNQTLSLKEVFHLTTWKNRTLSIISLNGMMTNFKDGMAWGLFPLFFASSSLSINQIGTIIAVYPAAWGFFQLFVGALSDRIGRKLLITIGMCTQAFALWGILLVDNYALWLFFSFLLGIGTAMVYPTLIAAVSDVAHADWRASSLGIYRFWRDSGYAFGALAAGFFADLFSIEWAIAIVALLPLLAGIRTAFTMEETLKI